MQKGELPTPKTIAEYIMTLPEAEQDALCKLWEIIKEIAPDAQEIISYQVPVFKYHGSLVGFGAAKKHLSFYVMSMTLLKDLEADLVGYTYEGSTLRFTVEKPLPRALVEKIVRTRVAMNEAKRKK